MSEPSAAQEPDEIMVGKIIKTHGIDGAVIVAPETDFVEERFSEGSQLYIRDQGDKQKVTVVSAREHQGNFIVEFKTIQGCDEAEKLRGADLVVPREAAIELPAGDYYGFELLDVSVYSQAGELLGTVNDFWQSGGQRGMEIKSNKYGKIDLPLHIELVEKIDRETKKIVINLPRGWKSLIRD